MRQSDLKTGLKAEPWLRTTPVIFRLLPLYICAVQDSLTLPK
ncbi:hypothetical protein [Planktotalea arctica]